MAFGAKVKLEVDKSGVRSFRSEIQKYVDNATVGNPVKIKNVQIEINKGQQSQLQRSLQSYLNNSNLTVKVNNIDASSAIQNFRTQLQTMLSGLSITGLKDFLGTDGLNASIDGAQDRLEKMADAADAVKVKNEQAATAIKMLNSLQSASDSTYKSGLKVSDRDNIEGLTNQYQELCNEIQRAKNLSGDEQQSVINGITQKQVALKAYINSIVESQKAAASASAAENNDSKNKLVSLHQMAALYKQINLYMAANTSVAKHSDSLKGFASELSSGTEITLERFNKIKDSFAQIRMAAHSAGIEGKSFGEILAGAYQKFGGWMLVTKTLMSAIQVIRKMVTAVTDLDTSMTELKKVTDLTDSQYRTFFTDAIQRAKKLGATVADTITATADFARLGYGVPDASRLAEAAIIYKNVGDGIDNISTASESIISTMKAFDIQADKSMDIVHKFNEIGNNFAISSYGIGESLKRSASALAAAGNTIDETIALAVGMNATVQDAEKVGVVLKTASMFLRAAKTEAEKAGESTDGMANSVSKLREELLKLTNQKVDIMIDNTSFKSTFQIYKELAGVWKELSDIDAANILELIGGKRNADANMSLINNFADAEAALSSSMQASGSAIKENEKVLESIQGKLNQFSASFEQLSSTFINSGLVKGTVDLGKGLLTLLNSLQKLHILLPAIITSISLIRAYGIAQITAESTVKITALSAAILREKAVTEQLSASVAMLSLKEKERLAAQIQAAVVSGTVTQAEAAQILATLGLATAEGTLAVANKGLAVSFKSLMASIPVWGWIALGVTVVIEAVTALTDKFRQNKTAAIDSANEIINKYSEANNSYQSNIKTISSLQDEFKRLSSGVDENGNNIKLTADEYDRYLSIIDQLIEISPDICYGYDNEGRAILNYKTALEQAIKSQENYIKNQRNIYLGNGKDLYDGKAAEYKNTQKDLGKSGESLGSSIYGSTWSSITNPKKTQDKINAVNSTFSDLGIQWKAGVHTWKESYSQLMQMYEQADEIIIQLRNSGAWTEEEINGISKALGGLAGAYTTLNAVEKEQIDYLAEWSKDQDWYKDMPISAVDEFKNGLVSINDPLKSYNDNLSNAAAFGKEFSSALSGDSIQKIINMSQGLKDGTVSLEDFNAEIENFKASWSGSEAVLDSIISYLTSLSRGLNTIPNFVNPLDFTDMNKGLETAVKGIDNIVSAMDRLKEGTALTKGAIAQLALEYPKLLEAANLFTDGSVEGQRKMLNAVLDMNEKEYDAQIDKKIKELEATNEVLKSQVELEEQKANIILEISNATANGEIENEVWLSNKLAEYNDLQGKNYVTMQDGVLKVNKDTLDKHLKQENEAGANSANIWNEEAHVITGSHNNGLSGALKAINGFGAKLKSWMNIVKEQWNKLFNKDSTISDLSVDSNISANSSDYKYNDQKTTIDGLSADDWIKKQQDAIAERTKQVLAQIDTNMNAINNLTALKGLELEDIYSDYTPKDPKKEKEKKEKTEKEKKEIEEYIATVEDYREALQKLYDIEVEQARLEYELEHSKSAMEKVEIQKKLNNIYKERQDALHHLNNLRDSTIHNTIPALEALGFEIEYNADTNRLFIKNLEHLNDLTATSAGKYETLQEATNEFRKETEKLIENITELNEENEKSSEKWLELADSITEGKTKIVEFLDSIVTEATDSVKAINDIYTTLKDAADNYAETGYVAVDTLLSIIELGTQYLTYLKNESGQLVINEENIQKIIAARTEQMAVETAFSYVEKLKFALIEKDTSELNRLLDATEAASGATWDLVYANLALLNLDDNQYSKATKNLDNLRSLADGAIAGLGSSSADLSSEVSDSLKSILDLTMELIEHEAKQKVEALQKQIDDYHEIIDLKKKSLNLSKEEKNYNKELAAKIKEISKLQQSIGQLSLDDSREAQAEKKKLEEELSKLQIDMADYQSDYSLDKQLEALDEESDAYKKTKENEIKIVEDTVSSTEKVYRLAIERITNAWSTDWQGLYNDLISWNYTYGNKIESDIVSAWDKASEAVKKYGTYLDAVNSTKEVDSKNNTVVSSSGSYNSTEAKNIISKMRQNSLDYFAVDSDEQNRLKEQNVNLASQLSKMLGQEITHSNGSWYKPDGSLLYSFTTDDIISNIVKAMKSNSSKWTSAPETEKNNLVKKNEQLAGFISSFTNSNVSKDGDGVWWINGKPLYDVYHSGGIVGGNGGIKDNEVMSLLERGELVLDNKKKDSVYKYIDISTYMLEKFGKAFSSQQALPIFNFNPVGDILKSGGNTDALNNISKAETSFVIDKLEVNAPVQVLKKLDETEIREHSRMIGSISAEYIKEGFTKRGIKPSIGIL